MAIEATTEDVRLLLTLAAQNGLVELREKFHDVYYRHEHPVVAFLSTIARLQYLEAQLVRAFAETVGKPVGDATDMARDVKKMVAMLQVNSGSLPKEEALAIYRDLRIDETLEAADKQRRERGDGGAGQKEVFASALTDLNEALSKMQRDKEEQLRTMAKDPTGGFS